MDFNRKKINEKKGGKGLLNFLIIIILIITVSYFYGKGQYNNFKTAKLITETKIIKINSGDSLSNLGEKISELNNFWYKIYIKYNKSNFKLAEGSYELEKGQNLEEIFDSLQKPILKETNITILEGWNIYDIDLNLTKKGLIEKGDFIKYVTNKEKITALSEFFPFLKNRKLESLEGFLYPETYKVNIKEFAVNILVIAQLEEFEKRVYNKIFENKYDNETIYDVVNLASIVEREEKILENKATVAGILKKRLNNDWMIGADATVCYPHKITSAECTQSFINNHVSEKNKYNTRTIKGLPKTAIGNASYETIEATLNDKKTNYWYYLHNLNTGKIYYAKNEIEHKYNIKNNMRK